MKKIGTSLFLFASIMSAQNNFVRGIYVADSIYAAYDLMANELHLNYVQAMGEDIHGTKFPIVLQNSGNLNVLGTMYKELTNKSYSQHLLYQAERSESPLYNYFNETPRGEQDQSQPTLLVSVGSAGYSITVSISAWTVDGNSKHGHS